jgi:hypothetical protein
MLSSGLLFRRLEQILASGSDSERKVTECHEAFIRLGDIEPEDLAEDLFSFFRDHIERDGTSVECMRGLVTLADIWRQEYDPSADALETAAWEFLRDSVSAYGEEIDMDLLNYLVKIMVEKGLFAGDQKQ